MRALITGGAGFIGTHIAQALLHRGDTVLLLDNLEPSVHPHAPKDLPPNAPLLRGDVRRPHDLQAALQRPVDVVFHQAGIVGLGQGETDRAKFFDVNVQGTQHLIEHLAKQSPRPRFVLASSMAVYGEGAYHCPSCNQPRPGTRTEAQLQTAQWEPLCPACGSTLRPAAVPETHPFRPATAYAQSKAEQETLALRLGREHGVPTVALRYHNVYGPRMPRNTPYAGVASLLKARVLAGRPPLVHEDGGQLRDFVHAEDVAQANLLAADAPHDAIDGESFNIGSGQPLTILQLATALAKARDPSGRVELSGTYRPGDARHVFGNIDKARHQLRYQPRVAYEDGFRRFVDDPMRAPAAEAPPQ